MTTAAERPESVTIVCPLPPAELDPNRAATNRYALARARRQAKDDGFFAAFNVVGADKPGWARVRATAVFVGVHGSRDEDNLKSWLKYTRDGIAAALGMPSDHGWVWERAAVARIKAQPGVTIVITKAEG